MYPIEPWQPCRTLITVLKPFAQRALIATYVVDGVITRMLLSNEPPLDSYIVVAYFEEHISIKYGGKASPFPEAELQWSWKTRMYTLRYQSPGGATCSSSADTATIIAWAKANG